MVPKSTPEERIIERNISVFDNKRVLVCGCSSPDLLKQFNASKVKVYTNNYHCWLALSRTVGYRCIFSTTIDFSLYDNYDAVLYFFPKDKQEALFYLNQLFSLLIVGTEFFIVGENRCGVRSLPKMVEENLSLKKIDNARHCSLFHGFLEKQSSFSLDNWWHYYYVNSLKIATLPGVFSRDNLDEGTRLLISTLNTLTPKGKLLDMGSGSGVIASSVGLLYPKINLTLCDIHASAIASSKKTLAINNIPGKVISSDLYSSLQDRYHIIVANPPFHKGIHLSMNIGKTLIQQASDYLYNNGELRIVTNSFLPYPEILNKVFGLHHVLIQNNHFKVYSAKKR